MGRENRFLCQQLAGIHNAMRIKPLHDVMKNRHPQRSFFHFQVTGMIESHAVLVGNRALFAHDCLACGRLEPAPLFQCLIRVGSQTEQIGCVDAGPIRIEMRQMGEDMDARSTVFQGRF